ncbi:helix-turn-helix transcriptional regulator [Ralstonia nicotianae]
MLYRAAPLSAWAILFVWDFRAQIGRSFPICLKRGRDASICLEADFLESRMSSHETRTADLAIAQVRMAQACPDALLNTNAVRLLTGWSRPSLYRHTKAGDFPQPVMPGRWRGGDVLAHLAKKAVKQKDVA